MYGEACGSVSQSRGVECPVWKRDEDGQLAWRGIASSPRSSRTISELKMKY